MLAREYDDCDPTGWWISEKLDGVRAYWTGTELLTRNGNRINAPAWFTSALPSCALDGELWIGRGQFQKCASIVRTIIPDERWAKVQFAVFDAPETPGGFEQRIGSVEFDSPHVYWLKQTRCTGLAHMQAVMNDIVASGGEGLMLRRAKSPYDRKRSGHLLKVKASTDCDAVVVGYKPGEGRLANMIGALEVTASGKRFFVGTGLTDDDRANPPKIGDKIIVGFNGLTDDGIPRHPRFTGIRAD